MAARKAAFGNVSAMAKNAGALKLQGKINRDVARGKASGYGPGERRGRLITARGAFSGGAKRGMNVKAGRGG